jgi:hypothetical protein
VLVLVSKVSRSRLTRPEGELIREVGGRGLGADTPVVGVPARKDAPFLGAAMVGVIAVVVGVIDAETPVAQLPEQTLRFRMVGVCLVALEAVRVRGGLTALMLAQCKAWTALHVVVVLFVLRPFAGNETGEGASRRGGRATLVEMGDEAGANGGVGEAALGVQKLTFELLFAVLDGDFLPLAALSLIDVRAVPVDISDNARVLEVSKGIIDEGTGSVGGVENVVVRIFGTWAIEIGRGEGACMKREGVDYTAFLTSTHESGLVSYWLVGDVLGGLRLAELVDEDERIMPKVSGVKLLPSFARMVSISDEGEGVVARAGDGNGTGGKAAVDNGSRGAGEWLFFVHVAKKDVCEGGDVKEVEDIVVLLDVDVEGLILESLIGEYCDGGEETIGPGVKGFS